MSTYYVDCEFDGHNGPLLSMALLREDGESLYIVVQNDPKDEWVIDNVMPIIYECDPDNYYNIENQNEVGEIIREFITEKSFTLISDSPVDIGRFCNQLSTSSDGNWESTGYDSIQFVVLNIDAYPSNVEGAIQHNALWDAIALKAKIDENIN